MLNGSAYMREPWPKGPTYAITEDGYRGLLYIQPEQLPWWSRRGRSGTGR